MAGSGRPPSRSGLPRRRVVKPLSQVLASLWEDLIRPLSGPVGVRLRRAWYSARAQACGARLTIEPGAHLIGVEHMSFGDDCWIDRNVVLIAGPMAASAKVSRRGSADVPAGRLTLGSRCHLGIGAIIQAHGGVEIGDDFTTSAGCKLYSVSNDVRGCRGGTIRTPEGEFYVFVKNPKSSYYLSLGVSYPNAEDAERGLRDGLITRAERDAIAAAARAKTMPPQTTRLGGLIYIHGNGSRSDWTLGCVALEDREMKELFDAVGVGTPVTILP